MKFIGTQYKVFSGILVGFLIYGLKEFAELLYHPLQRIVAFIGLLFIFASPFLFTRKVINPLKGNIKILFFIYLIWIIFIITRPLLSGQPYSSNSIHPYATFGLISYLLPFIVLLGVENISLPRLFKISYVFALIGFVFFIFNFKNMQAVLTSGLIDSTDDETGITLVANKYRFWFGISSLSLLCYEFISQKHRWVAIISSFFTLFLMTCFARRTGIFMFLLFFAGAFYLYIFNSKQGNLYLKIFFVIFVIIFVGATFWMSADTTFSLLFDRLNEDTRSGVDESLVHYLDNENAWLIGKGIEGTYPDINFDEPRYTHETGYLYLILKGGIIYLCLYCFIILYSAYLGFFKTNNRLTKALALYIFFYVILLVPFGVPSFSLEYLFIWIGVAVCQSKEWRLMTNNGAKYYLLRHN